MAKSRWFISFPSFALFLLASASSLAQTCADSCQLGEVSGNANCELWDGQVGQWVETIDDGPGQLHNRARLYLPWLRGRLMPAGGVMSAAFTDNSFERIAGYGGRRDSAIWTGAYLAAEALRYMATGAMDAMAQMEETAHVLHRWWNIPGDPGYLARYAAPASSPPEIQAILPADDDEVYRDWLYDGVFWHWRGDISRDQYQGVLLGYALAYDATGDPDLREMLRADLVELAERLMRRERRQVKLVINGQTIAIEMELENVVTLAAAMPDGVPTLEIDIGTGEIKGRGILVFWPNPSEYIRQVPGLAWVPDILLPTQAIQLGAAFRIALHVTEGAAGYEERRAALVDYYNRNFDGWVDIAAEWENSNDCGDSYHGLNIGFMPMYNWTRLETDSARQSRLRDEVLVERMWPAVADHKNALFAFIYASQSPDGSDIAGIVAEHADQLAGFPASPNVAVPVDLRDTYPEDPDCPDLSAVAIDVSQRVPATFIWERQPWKRYDPGMPNLVYGGVDYLLAYWMGRRYGYIGDDAPGTCLAYNAVALPGPQPPGTLEIPQPNSYQTGIGLVSGWFCDAQQVHIQIDGGRLIRTAYGTERADTQGICGDKNNGYGFLINYNALADGEHRIAAFADGLPFDSATFNVRTLGQEFRTGLQGDFSLGDFPELGQSTLLRWQQANQGFVITGFDPGTPAVAPLSQSDLPGTLEIPQPGSSQSGIGLVSGWYCDAVSVTMQIDGGRMIPVAYGTERADTMGVCGDINNGFGFLINYAALGDGPHTIATYADGLPFAGVSFNVQTLGQEFATGLFGHFPLMGFPQLGLETQVRWQEANQGFVITGVFLDADED